MVAPVQPPAAAHPVVAQGFTTKQVVVAMTVAAAATVVFYNYCMEKIRDTDNARAGLLYQLNITDRNGDVQWMPCLFSVYFLWKQLTAPVAVAAPAQPPKISNTIFAGEEGQYLNYLRNEVAGLLNLHKTQKEKIRELIERIKDVEEKLSQSASISNDPGFQKFLETQKAPKPPASSSARAAPQPDASEQIERERLRAGFRQLWNERTGRTDLKTGELLDTIFQELKIGQKGIQAIMSDSAIMAMIHARSELDNYASQHRR